MEIKTDNLPEIKKTNGINDLIESKINQTQDEKVAINLLSTRNALQEQETVDKLVDEKTNELIKNAEARRIEAETEKINKEVEKVRAEKEKEIAEFDKIINAKRKEVEELQADSDKAQSFFEANKEILKYIGVRNKKSLGVMKTLMYPATIIFIVVQILLFPLTFVGVTLESIVNIVGGICGSIKHNALKITIAIAIVILILGVITGCFVIGGKILSK